MGGKLSGILKLVGKVFLVLAVIVVLGVNGTIAYIMFAPDDFPKPFYLMYLTPEGEANVPVVIQVNGEGGETEVAGGGGGEESSEPSHSVLPGEGFMFSTGSKTVNLLDPTGRKYLKVTVVLEFEPGEGYYVEDEELRNEYIQAFNDEISGLLPVINDTITTILSGKTFESIYTVEGKDALRVEIMDAINVRLPGHTVIAVYFTEFVVQ